MKSSDQGHGLAHRAYLGLVRRLSGTGLSRIWPLGALHDWVTDRFREDHVQLGEYRLRLDPDDSVRLSFYGEYEPAETALVRDIVKPGDTVVDIGAHIGYFTVLFAECAGPEGRVHAFEPAPNNFAILEENVASNRLDSVTCVHAAVGPARNTCKLYLAQGNSVDHHLYDAQEKRKAVEVDVIALDEYFSDADTVIDFLKMDIQGGEARALAGMERLLRTGRIASILMEFWPKGLIAAGADPVDLLNRLVEWGYTVEEIGDDGLRPADAMSLLERFTPENDLHTNLHISRIHASEEA